MSLEAALASLRAGRPVVLYDDRGPRRACARVVPADAGPEIASWRPDGVTHLTLALEAARLNRFSGQAPFSPKGSMRIALKGDDDVVTAARAVLDLAVTAADFREGGGLRLAPIAPGGALAVRALEAGASDLVRLAVGSDAALLVAEPADRETAQFAATTLTEVAAYRERTEVLVEAAAIARLPSTAGASGLMAHAFVSLYDGVEHLAVVKGAPEPGALVRIHSECLTGDALGSLRCDCGEQLRAALSRIAAAASGALIYLRGHEGRGIGLANKIRAYALQDQGLDTAQANTALGFPEDSREYAIAAQILKRLGLFDVRLLSNNPRKACALKSFGVTVREELPLFLAANPHNRSYLSTKRDKFGHRIPDLEAGPFARVGRD
jgi:3,4-dihydroxy 2-butanone 4-phosphate synthase/GTP cyclohydrolase II